jgi:hypothetical protein
MDIDDVLVFLEKRDLDIGVLSAFFGENLDAEVVVFVGGPTVVVSVDLSVENDGGRARCLRLAFEGQLVCGGRLEADTGGGGGRSSDDAEKKCS